MADIRFNLNGEQVRVGGVDPNTTLLDWLRDSGRTGTKEGCAEGECGACAVALVRTDPEGRVRYEPVNSCLVLLPSMHGHEIVSVEGVACPDKLHPVQSLMAKGGGSQCGYCTPGFVVSLFAEYYRPGREGYDPESVGGNLCRCTGYRPIRDAAKEMGYPDSSDPAQLRLAEAAPPSEGINYRSGEREFYRPSTLEEALRYRADHPDAKPIGGGTDLVVEVNLRHQRWGKLLSLDAIESLREIVWHDDFVEIGASISLSHLEEALGESVPMLGELLPLFSSRLIRNRATLGGNVCNASPIGDSPPVLLALDAEVKLQSVDGERWVAISEFFLGYRKTALAPNELLTRVRIPRPFPKTSRFYKVSKRIMDDISTVAAAFTLRLDDSGAVEEIRLAFGGVAATPARAAAAEEAVRGLPWDQAAHDVARAKLLDAFTPMTDHRGSAAYRDAMISSLFDKFIHETTEALS